MNDDLNTSLMNMKQAVILSKQRTEIREKYLAIITANPEIDAYVQWKVNKSVLLGVFLGVFLGIIGAELIWLGMILG